MAALDNKLDGAFEAFGISEEPKKAKCLHYDILTPHEFEINTEGTTVFTVDSMVQCHQKLFHKWQVMQRAILGNPGETLFVRMGGHASPAVDWPYFYDQHTLTTEDVLRLTRSLQGAFPGAAFSLLLVIDSGYLQHAIDRTRLPPNVYVHDINWGNDGARWEGRDAAWDEAFRLVEMVPQEALG